ncbi:MAG: DUF4367 domain-containing protein [Oscillospiraceae bacterium]|jgi:hypothetical protein|nr:DUF4367 domain-containing protein [Oscillospiraceae bacterium]
MKEPIFKDNSVLEAVFRQAVIENYENELDELNNEPDVSVSDRHRRRMEALFAKARREKQTAVIIVWAKRFSAAAASLLVIVGALLMTVPAVRASAGEAFVAFCEKYVTFGSGSAEVPDAAVDWSPTFIPEGFSESSRAQFTTITVIRYADAEGEIIEFMYMPADDSMSVNYEHVDYGQTLHGDIVYHTFAAETDEYKSAVVWDTDGYIFNVTAYLPVEQLLEIAWSVGGK